MVKAFSYVKKVFLFCYFSCVTRGQGLFLREKGRWMFFFKLGSVSINLFVKKSSYFYILFWSELVAKSYFLEFYVSV